MYSLCNLLSSMGLKNIRQSPPPSQRPLPICIMNINNNKYKNDLSTGGNRMYRQSVYDVKQLLDVF